MIREEAVKAAVKAFRDAHEAAEKAWMEQPGAETPNLESYLRAALEAAAPHMVQAAYYPGLEHGANQPTNPYRSGNE